MRKRTIQLGAGLVAFAAIGIIAEAVPTWRRVQKLGMRCEETRAELLLVSDRPVELARQADELSKVKAFVQDHVKPVPGESDVAGLVRSLSQLMDTEGITQREIATGVAARGDHTWTLPLTLKMRGSFTSVFAVVDRIETLPRLIKLKRVELRLEGDPDKRSGLVTANLLLELVYGKGEVTG